jgi:pimeloyl-ACP methyl ester carboxylesterase
MPHVDGVTHRYVDVGGLRMHVAEAGAGPPLVLLHGWPQNWYAYRHLIPERANEYRVIAPDLRGWGWTDAPPRGYEKRQLVKDITGLLDALSIDEPIRLVGHDWGSIVGFMMCVERPELVSHYLALGGGHLWPNLDLKLAYAMRWWWYQALIITPVLGQRLVGSPAFVRFLYRLWSANPRTWTRAELDALIGQFPALREPLDCRDGRLLDAQLQACSCAPDPSTLTRLVSPSIEDGQPAPALRCADPRVMALLACLARSSTCSRA